MTIRLPTLPLENEASSTIIEFVETLLRDYKSKLRSEVISFCNSTPEMFTLLVEIVFWLNGNDKKLLVELIISFTIKVETNFGCWLCDDDQSILTPNWLIEHYNFFESYHFYCVLRSIFRHTSILIELLYFLPPSLEMVNFISEFSYSDLWDEQSKMTFFFKFLECDELLNNPNYVCQVLQLCPVRNLIDTITFQTFKKLYVLLFRDDNLTNIQVALHLLNCLLAQENGFTLNKSGIFFCGSKLLGFQDINLIFDFLQSPYKRQFLIECSHLTMMCIWLALKDDLKHNARFWVVLKDKMIFDKIQLIFFGQRDLLHIIHHMKRKLQRHLNIISKGVTGSE